MYIELHMDHVLLCKLDFNKADYKKENLCVCKRDSLYPGCTWS
jgi:hypothetical protein